MFAAAVEHLADIVRDQALSLVVGAALTAGAGYVRWLLVKRLPARRTWRFPDEAGRLVMVVSSSAEVDTGQYTRPTTGVGQVRAMSLLVPRLARAYREVDLQQVSLSERLPGRDLESDLLLLGGPKTNEITGRALAEIPGLPLTVSGNVITWDGSRHEGVVATERVVRDFGYVVRAPSPFAPGRRLVIVAGSHTFGTVAAARWLAERGGDRDVPENVAVLVEAPVLRDGHVGVPKELHRVPLSGARVPAQRG
ncbi:MULTISPECIES: hypothetical protein [Streptomyces]|uniref:hypothetical protein n=1 Tax=Streptomyces TaxID=1883 RepID=UPI000CD59BA3|nr:MULTISPECIES: hypothetical protein [Streptomyces]